MMWQNKAWTLRTPIDNDFLSSIGEDGWQLVSAVPNERVGFTTIYARRPKRDQSESVYPSPIEPGSDDFIFVVSV